METVHSFTMKSIDGKLVPLSEYAGKVLLIVNTASNCGFTPQYKGLEELQQSYAKDGFSVLGFPCNQFGAQEPGSEADIKTFCSVNYQVTFPMFAKIDVNGDNADPLYKYLTKSAPGILGTEAIKWNFTKFLIGKDGKVLERYAPNTKPADIVDDIVAAMKGK
ncbi:MAG: glutathione peroxidase [bacterium]|nr:glutathione peroxidase [bacterium]